jgi:hypothetical protein
MVVEIQLRVKNPSFFSSVSPKLHFSLASGFGSLPPRPAGLSSSHHNITSLDILHSSFPSRLFTTFVVY